MALPRFEYLSPGTLDEACALLAEHGADARPMAGGTDLLLRMGRTGRAPSFVVGLRRVPGLADVRFDREHGLSIGALASLATVAAHPDVIRHYPALAQAAAATATVQIRNMGTVAGNLCNASPSADTAPPLLAHGAEVLLHRREGERRLSLSRFFRGPGRNALEPGELLREIHLPPPGERTGSDYQRISQRSQVDIAAASVAARVALDEEGICRSARLALGAVAPTPLLVDEAAALLEGRPITDEQVAAAAALAVRAARPISDVRASAAWRKKVIGVLAARALRAAVEKALAQ